MLKKLLMFSLIGLLVPHVCDAAVVQFNVTLDSSTNGTGSPGMGTATAFLNELTGQFDVTGTFSGLNGNATNVHLHGPTGSMGSGNAGVLVSGFTFDSGVTSGSFSRTGGVIAPGNIAATLNGETYINIHSSTNTGGEIRGYLLNPVAIPEPGSFAALCVFAVGAAVRRRRR